MKELKKAQDELFAAIEWNLNPYVDEYSIEYLEDNYPHIAELLEAYRKFNPEY